jgi:hypothetical protein
MSTTAERVAESMVMSGATWGCWAELCIGKRTYKAPNTMAAMVKRIRFFIGINTPFLTG